MGCPSQFTWGLIFNGMEFHFGSDSTSNNPILIFRRVLHGVTLAISSRFTHLYDIYVEYLREMLLLFVRASHIWPTQNLLHR